MRIVVSAAVAAVLMSLGVAAQTPAAKRPKLAVAHQATRPAPVPAGLTAEAQNELVKTYCATCHSERGKAGGLSLAGFDATAVVQHADVAEKMIRKLRAGMMPP